MNEKTENAQPENAAEWKALEGEVETAAEQAQRAEEPQGPPEPSTGELIFPIVAVSFAILAPAWRVSDAESKQLADSYGAVVDKYWPDGLGGFGVELNALLLTAAIIGPRLRVPRQAPPPEPAPEQGAADGSA